MGGLPETGVQLVVKGLSQFLGVLNQGNAAVKGFGDEAGKSATRSSAFTEIIVGGLRQIGALAIDALGKAANAVKNFVGDSVKVAGDFQANMSQFQMVAGADVNTKGLEKFKDLFISLGKELPVSTSDVQQAAIEMVKGGIDPAIVAAGGLRQNIQFAAAAMGGDLVGAAEISAKVLGGWADINATATEKATFLTHATDLLTKAANASSVDVHELSLGLFNAQGTAQAAGVAYDDLVTTLAELAPKFASSSEAGNALKNVIVRLQPSTQPAIDKFEELGLSTTSTTKLMEFLTKNGIKPLGTDLDTLGNQFTEFATSQGFTQKETDKLWKTFSATKFFDDVTGKFVGFQKASEILKTSLVGLTDAQRIQALQTMFGSDGMNAASALAINGADGYDKMADALLKANGVQAAAELTQTGFNTSMENTKGSIEALQITLGLKLLPALSTLMDTYIAPGINTLTQFASAVFGNKDAMEGLTTPLQNAASYLKDVVSAFEGVSKGTLGIKTALEVVKPGLGGFIESAEKIVSTIGDNFVAIIAGVGTALAVALTPALITATAAAIPLAIEMAGIVIPLVAIGVAVGILVTAWENNWGGIQEKTAAVWAFIEPVFTQLSNWLSIQIPAAVTTVSSFWTGTLWPALQQVGTFISTNIVPILTTLAKVALAELQIEVAAVSAVWQNVLWPALKIVWDFLANTLIPIIAALVDVNIAALQIAVTALAGLWEKVLWPALKNVGSYLSNTLGPVIKDVGKWFTDTVVPALQSAVTWLDKSTGGFKGIGTAVTDVIAKIHTFADSVRNLKLPDWLTPGSPTPWEIALRGIGDAFDNEVTPGVDNFTSSLTRMAPLTAKAGSAAIDGLSKAFTSDVVVNHAKDLAEGIINAFEGTWKIASPSQVFYQLGINAAIGLENALTASIPGLHGVVEQMGIDLMNTTRHHLQSTVDDINNMIEDLQKKIDETQKMSANLVIGGYSSTANMDRQVISNQDELDKLKDARTKQQTAAQLQDAEKAAKLMQDPKQAAEYFQARSQAIIESAQIQERLANDLNSTQKAQLQENVSQYQKDINALGDQQKDIKKQLGDATEANDVQQMTILQAQSDYLTDQIDHWQSRMSDAQTQLQGDLTEAQRQQLIQRWTLIYDAQRNEASAFDAKQAQGSDTSAYLSSLQEILSNPKLPGYFDNDQIRLISNLVNQLSNMPATGQAALAALAYQPQTNNTTQYNLGVMTNQSPAVVQQSYAAMQASQI